MKIPAASPITPLPMVVITGYLGAGKTTFVNRLLRDPQGLRITVLVNDFGSISLDENLIFNQQGDIIALANGCMCCQIGGDLYRTIDTILENRSATDYLVVETSGVADPAKIADIARAEPDLKLACILTLVDAVNFNTLTNEPMLADTLRRQIIAANILLITKSEMSGHQEIEQLGQYLRGESPGASVLEDADLALSMILAADDNFHNTRQTPSTFDLKPEIHKVPFGNWSWQGHARIDRKDLIAFLEDPALGIYRSKGIVALSDGMTVVVHKAGGIIEIKETTTSADLSRIVFIGVASAFDSTACERGWHELISKDQKV